MLLVWKLRVFLIVFRVLVNPQPVRQAAQKPAMGAQCPMPVLPRQPDFVEDANRALKLGAVITAFVPTIFMQPSVIRW